MKVFANHTSAVKIFLVSKMCPCDLYTHMDFRNYLAADQASTTDTTLAEADLLGKPAIASSPAPPATSPPEPKHDLSQDPTPNAGRPPGQMDDHMKKALELSIELGKLLAGLPHPWNKQFHRYIEVLRSLIAKLREAT